MTRFYNRLGILGFIVTFSAMIGAVQHPPGADTSSMRERPTAGRKPKQSAKTPRSAPWASAKGTPKTPATYVGEGQEVPESLPPAMEAPLGYEFDLQTLKRLKTTAPALKGVRPVAVDDASPNRTPAGSVKGSKRGAATDVKDATPEKSPAAPSFPAPTPALSFEGIYDTGSHPPDNGTAAGPNHVLEMVNPAWRAFAKDGTPVTPMIPFCGSGGWWTSDLPGGVTWCFDPRVIYDQFEDRWVMLAVAMTNTQDQSWYLLATSYTSDPTGGWCTWSLDATIDGMNPTDNWADFPGLGLDNQAIYISSNQFSIADLFQYSKVRILGKTQLYNNSCGGVSGWDWWGLTNTDSSLAFTMQPAHTFGTPGVEYLVNSRSGSGNSITLWSLTNPLGNPPTLTKVNIPVSSYSAPPDASQCNSATPIDTTDARLQNAIFRDGYLWTAHTIERGSYTGARLLRIEPVTPSVLEDFVFGLDGYFYYFPAVTVDGEGNIYTVFNRSSVGECVGIRYAGRPSPDPPNTFPPSAQLQGGLSGYVRLDTLGRNRWGDYSGIAADPIQSNAVWVAGEYVAATNVWSTRIGRLEYGATLTITPPSLMFDAQQVGLWSLPQTLTLRNTGGSSVTLNSIEVMGGNDLDFARDSTCGNLPSMLAPGGSCTIDVFFKPTAAGPRKSSVVVADDAAGSPQIVVLTGLGTQ